MEASELRIGNYVLDEKDAVCVIKSINNYMVDMECLYSEGVSTRFPNKHLVPIGLNEEWLLRFGFEKIEYSDDKHGFGEEYHLKVNEDIFFNYSDDFSLAIYRNKKAIEDEIGILPKWEAIINVHQFQNLYHSLIGEEINLKEL